MSSYSYGQEPGGHICDRDRMHIYPWKQAFEGEGTVWWPREKKQNSEGTGRYAKDSINSMDMRNRKIKVLSVKSLYLACNSQLSVNARKGSEYILW